MTREEGGGHEASNDEALDGATTIGEYTAGSSSVGDLKIGKHVCPEEYANAFTPIEFEEVGGLDAGNEALRYPRY